MALRMTIKWDKMGKWFKLSNSCVFVLLRLVLRPGVLSIILFVVSVE